VEALYAEAVYLGIFSRLDPLDGLEVDIRIAKRLLIMFQRLLKHLARELDSAKIPYAESGLEQFQ